MDKKANHQANVIRLGEPRVHTNADTLELFDIPGTSYQVVTKKGQFKSGDLAVYIQPDSVVPQTEPFRFIWGEYEQNGATPEAKRRITVRRFRKEWSEGLLLPVTDFPNWCRDPVYHEGTDVSELIGITHWEGEADTANTGGDNSSQPKRKYPKTLRGWFYYILYKLGLRSVRRQMNEELSFDVPKFDVESLRNYKNVLIEGENVIVTEKIHGSQGRYTFRDGVFYAGSRNFWKAPDSPCVWRKALKDNPWIEEYCRSHEGFTLYGEVFPTQKGYRYGAEKDEVKFLVFDIRDEENNYLSKTELLNHDIALCPSVPVLYEGKYNSQTVTALTDGVSILGGKTPREGIVITAAPDRYVRGVGRVQLKLVSNSFLEKDGKR
jgi:hypothetical protein